MSKLHRPCVCGKCFDKVVLERNEWRSKAEALDADLAQSRRNEASLVKEIARQREAHAEQVKRLEEHSDGWKRNYDRMKLHCLDERREPVEGELLPEYVAMETDRDEWKAKAEALQAEIDGWKSEWDIRNHNPLVRHFIDIIARNKAALKCCSNCRWVDSMYVCESKDCAGAGDYRGWEQEEK